MSVNKEGNDELTNKSGTKVDGSESRFSRRRFVKYGAGASPLLLAIKSPAAWGGGQSFGNGNCSVTVMLSANSSAPQCTADIKSPGYWHRVLNSSQGSTHYVVKQALEQSNPSVYPALNFNTFFLSNFEVIHKGWRCFISPSSDDPTFIEVLPHGPGGGNSSDLTLLIRCEKMGEPSIPDLDIGRFPNVHRISISAYLNSMFAPNVIPYPYYPTQVIAGVQDMVTTIIERYIDEIAKGTAISNGMLNGVINPVKDAFKNRYKLW